MSTQGDRLKEERERTGLNQADFGALGHVKKQAQLKYEKGDRYPDGAYFEAIATSGVDVLYVVTGARTEKVLPKDEAELLSLFRAAPLSVKAAVLGALTATGEARPSKQQVFNAGVGQSVQVDGDFNQPGAKITGK